MRGHWNVNQAMPQGNVIYVDDGTDVRPAKGDTAGNVYVRSGTIEVTVLPQREYFIFYPGASALANGAVLSGTRTGAGTITTGGTADSTYWGPNSTYAPRRAGKIDGLAASGVVWGQLTIGIKTGAATADAKVTARISNTASGTTTTFLALSGTAIACTTAEIYKTYDLPYLFTDANFNAVPLSVAIGVQSSLSGTTIIGRIMEASRIEGYFEPGT